MRRARYKTNSVRGETKVPSPQPYAHLLSPWQIRHSRIANRVIFGPVCPTWVRSPHEGVFRGLRNGAAPAKMLRKATYRNTSTARLFRNAGFTRLEQKSIPDDRDETA
jgi:hypothetical protein